ncbi:MAG: carbon starvation protein A [Oligosphaeraceae bacterium]
MLIFLLGIGLLVLGYFTYGKMVERILAPDDRQTPALTRRDGVDFLVLPSWKNMLIQLLNIAGVGPVIGVILGIRFGAAVFLIIPLGNVLGGAVHDFASGMMSLRRNGENLPWMIRDSLGKKTYSIFAVFMAFLLLLVVAVFINIPANLINGMVPKAELFWLAVGVIFLYYILATLFPVDKIIGRIYPIFGGLLLVSTFALLLAILWHYSFTDKDLFLATPVLQKQFQGFRQTNPILPTLFVTIACGIMSGFHATQSPIIARTMSTEREARAAYYGMMIVEGVIAMIWAGGGYVLYNLHPVLFNVGATKVLPEIVNFFLGNMLGSLTILGVIILAVTSGDTAMRSLRLSMAEIFHIDQKSLKNRLLLCLPLIFIVSLLLWWSNKDAMSFGFLWNYFAWGNQVLAAFTLIATSVWLWRQRKNGWVTLLPGVFITFIVATYILWTSTSHKGPMGFGLPLPLAYALGSLVALLWGGWGYWLGHRTTQDANTPDAQ